MRMLVVDDEFVALTLMKQILSEYGECVTATNGKEALKLFEESVKNNKPFHLITIDIEMPGMNGVEFVREVNLIEREFGPPPCKKLMVSGEATPENVKAAGANNCDGFIVKPATKELMKRKLDRIGFFAADYAESDVVKEALEDEGEMPGDDAIQKARENSAKLTFLIVDDSPTQRLQIRKLLHKHYSCGILEARNGMDALDILTRQKPDLIFLDFNMPEMDGMEFLRNLRADTDMFSIPVIMLTSVEDKDTVYSLLQLGISGYVLKGLEPTVFTERLEKNIAKAISFTVKEEEVYEGEDDFEEFETLMVVDSDDDFVDTFRELFEDQYNIISTGDGKKALDWVEMYKPALIFLDEKLKPVSADVLAKKIATSNPKQHQQTFLLTTSRESGKIDSVYYSGALKKHDIPAALEKDFKKVVLKKGDSYTRIVKADHRDLVDRFRKVLQGNINNTEVSFDFNCNGLKNEMKYDIGMYVDMMQEENEVAISIGLAGTQQDFLLLSESLGCTEKLLNSRAVDQIGAYLRSVAADLAPWFKGNDVALTVGDYKLYDKSTVKSATHWQPSFAFKFNEKHNFLAGVLVSRVA